MVEDQGQPKVGVGEWRVLADEHRIDVHEIDVFGLGQADRVFGVELHRRLPNPCDDPAATKPHVAWQAVIDAMAASLRLQHQGKAGVFVDDDRRHGVHDEHETHEPLR